MIRVEAVMGLAMVNLRRCMRLSTADEEKPATALALVLERLSESVIDWDPGEAGNFREEMGTLTGGLRPDLPQKEMLTIAEAAMRAVANYNRRIAQKIEKQQRDFRTVIKMLRDSIVGMAGGHGDAVQPLSRIDEELESGSGIRDLQSLRIHLGGCLQSLRREVEREQAAARALIERLQIEAESRMKPGEEREPRSVNPAAGLPGQEECLAAIRESIAKGTRHYTIVMVVNRVEPIAARFGKEAGEWMVERFREEIERQFEEQDKLFRWGGPAIVAIVERRQPFDPVRASIKRMFEAPIRETIDVNGRSVFVPITAAWSVFMISPTPEVTEKQIRKFVSAQGCRDFV